MQLKLHMYVLFTSREISNPQIVPNRTHTIFQKNHTVTKCF